MTYVVDTGISHGLVYFEADSKVTSVGHPILNKINGMNTSEAIDLIKNSPRAFMWVKEINECIANENRLMQQKKEIMMKTNYALFPNS